MADATPEALATRGRRHRLSRILGVSAAILAFFLIAFIAALHTPPARRFVLRQVTQLLADQQIDLQTDELQYNLLDLSIAFRNLRIQSAQMPDAPPLLLIDQARADLSLIALLRGRYVVESGSAEGVRVHYLVDEAGRDNLPHPTHQAETSSEPLDYLLADLSISHAVVRYENRAQGIDLVLPVSTLLVKGTELTDRHDVQIQASAGELKIAERTVRLDRLSGTIDLGRDDVRMTKVELDAEGSHIEVNGAVSELADPVSDLTLRARVDAGRAALAAHLAEPVAGLIGLDMTAKGTWSALQFHARVTGSELRFRGIEDVELNVSADYAATERRARVSALELRAPWGALTADGSLSLEGSDESHVNAAIASLDAARLMQALDLPYVVATRLDARVQARWPALEFLQAAGDATAVLTPTRTSATKAVLPVGGRLDVTAHGERVTARFNRVRAAGARLDGLVDLTNRERLGGAVRVDVSDLARVVTEAEAVLGRRRGSLIPAPVAGALVVDGRLGGTLNAPRVTAGLSAPSLSIGGAREIGVLGEVAYAPEAVTIDRLDVAWHDASARAVGRVGLQGARPLDLEIRAADLQVPALLGVADRSSLPVTGTLSLHGKVAGTMSEPRASVEVRGVDLAAYNEPLGRLAATVQLEGREIDLSELTLDKPQPEGNGRLTASGRYDLDRTTYRANVQSENVRLIGLTLPDGRPVRGTLGLTARGAGTTAAPNADVDLAIDMLRLADDDFGRIVVDATVADQRAAIDVQAERFNLQATSVIGVAQPYPATLDARVDALDLAALPMRFDTPLLGNLRARVIASGELAQPRQARAEVTVDAFAGSWNDRPFAIDGPAVLRYAEERLAIDRLRLIAQDSTVTISGELPVDDRTADGTIDIDARANLATLAQYAPSGTSLSGEGAVRLTGRLRGTLDAIDPDLVLTIENALVLAPELEPGISGLDVRATVSNGEANLERLTANWGTARLDVSARLPLELLPELPVAIPRKGGPATLRARIDGLDPASVPGAPAGLNGRISVVADGSATRPDLAAIEGRVSFPELQLAFGGLALEQPQPSSIVLTGGTATIEQFALSGSAGTLAAGGTIGLLERRPLDVTARGAFNIAVASVFTEAVRAEGDAQVELSAKGTVVAPDLAGFVSLADATLAVDEPTIAAEDLAARVDVAGSRITLTSLTGRVNGGALTGSGVVTLGDGGVRDADLQFSTDDFAFDAPLELRSLTDSTIRVTHRAGELVAEGQITIQEAGLTGDINFDTGLLAAMTAPRKLDLTEERNPMLERVRLNINVDTATPILVDNNLARAEVTADLRVLGTPYETGLSGRLEVLEGGEITLNERHYEVERGEITFIDERRIFPSFDLRLMTSAGNYDVALVVTGTPGDTETTLTSDPVLPEPDIMALLVTGRTLEEMRGEEYEVAREQVLSYLTGRVGSTLGRGIERATGLSEVRIEPNLIANEADPSARLTVAQDLTGDLTLVYSSDLANSNDQIWVARYDLTRRFQTRAVRQSDNSYRFDFRHDVRAGGRPEPRRLARQRPVVAAVRVPSDAAAGETELRRMLGVTEGDAFDFFAARDGVEKIGAYYRDRGWLQSRVRLDRQVDGKSITLTLKVTTGPLVDLQFEGATPPSDVHEEVRLQWYRGVFDAQRADDGLEALRAWLISEDHLDPRIAYTIQDPMPGRRQVMFQIEPGTRFQTVERVFEGASGIAPEQLNAIIDDQRLHLQLFTDPIIATELLERYYREEGYLTAEIGAPRIHFEGTVARIVLPVTEGPRFTVRKVTTAGNAIITTPVLVGELPVVAGDPFLPSAAEQALERIRQLYWGRGYNDVRSDYALTVDRPAGAVDVAFTVEEGLQSVIAEIAIEGNDKTSQRLVREQLELVPDQPLDLSALGRSRRNLYGTAAFSIVDITREDLGERISETLRTDQSFSTTVPGPFLPNGPITSRTYIPLGGEAPAAPADAPDRNPSDGGAHEKPVRVNVSVREVQPFQLRYGASYDTERGVGGIFDLSNHNSLGKARVLGMSSRYDSQLREARGYINQPSLRYFPLQTTASVYYREERNPATDAADGFDVNRRGLSIQQEKKLANAYMWSYGYRYERARTFDPRPGGILDESVTVSPVTSTLTREARDEVLDASRGSFLSQAFAYSPSWLGSDQSFVKYYGQYFHYIPLQAPRRKPFSNEILRPRFVYAVGVRLGLAKGLDTLVPASERFYAGGSTTLRGFAQNAVGPIGLDGIPAGGNAILVINNELRFPLVSIVDGVAFLDVGNVFTRASDFSFTDLRESAGLGLRLRTRWFLLRGDYGFVLDRLPGERRGRFYFSIGQAF